MSAISWTWSTGTLGLIPKKLSKKFSPTTTSPESTKESQSILLARMRPADWAWSALATGVLAYEVAARPGELLSEGMDRYRAHHPVVAASIIIYLALHLLRLWPSRIDPLHRLAAGVKHDGMPTNVLSVHGRTDKRTA